jgi:amino acid adenylation domain-containing protein
MSTTNIEDVYPLSPMQEGLLFHSLYAPEGGLYITQVPFKIKAIDLSALERAWQRIVERHPIFRTAFVWKNIENPVQVVGRRVTMPFRHEDWRHLTGAEQEARFEAYLAEDRRRGFELNKAPLLRIVLFQTGDDAYTFLLTHHHILMDGWSTALVFKEVFALYEAFRNGRDLELEPTTHYREYIGWLKEQDLNEAEAFWRETLKGFTAPTPLVVDTIPGRELSSEEIYVEEFIFLSPAVMSELQALVRQHQLTVNTVLQGAWALLLSRYSGEKDVVFGAVMAGRPASLPGVESVVGLFINNLPARIRISPQQPVVSWLKEVQAQQAEARQYEYSPLSQVQTWSEVPSGSRLFESIVSFQNFPVSDSLIRAGQEFESIHTIETGPYPLTLMASAGEELVIPIRYDRRFFDAATAKRIAGHLQTILEAIVANPLQTLRHIPLLTSDELLRLRSSFNHSPSPPSPPLCIHQLFELQAASRPDATALTSLSATSLSFTELNLRANQLAHYLRSLGVGPEVPVALCLDRGPHLIISLLAILKAGGAYVPLDPSYPLERLSFMLEEARVPVLLTTEQLLDALPAFHGQVICLDEEADAIAAQDCSNPQNLTIGDNLAYIIYTSGSTGRPKGVSVTHRAVVRLACAGGFAEVGPEEVFLQMAPVSFDASTFEIWGSLLNGSRLVVMEGEAPTLSALGEVIAGHGVTTLWLTAGLFHLMVDERVEELRGLRQLLAGGDVLSPRHVEKFLREVKGCRLINGYGPTEGTTFTCCYEVKGEWEASRAVPIGYPIGQTEVYILDEEGRMVPEGVWGELYIGGEGLARGYTGGGGQTAEKFVPSEYEEGGRLYRSGDVVRYLGDGSIEFRGRADGQVKVRGYRVEVGEIEQVMGGHPGVREVVVVAREEKEGEGKQLIAYVVSLQPQGITPRDLRAYAKEHLPEYMVPAVFVLIDRLPLTPNGKVDSKALPLPGEANAEPEQTYVAPRNPVEETIALIWSELLNVERVGINDNFFDLGGHSIFVIQVLSRLNKAFNLELSLRTIYDRPTPAELALTIVEQQAEQADGAELRELLAELEDLSDDEAQKILAGDPTIA